MSPEVQTAINNFLAFLATFLTALGAVFAAFYRIRSQADAEHKKAQTEAVKTQAAEIPNLAAMMTQILEKTTETMNALVAQQAQADLITKRALDQREPLESALKMNTEAIAAFREIMAGVRDATLSPTQTLSNTIRQMTGAGAGIIVGVNTHTDELANGLGAMLTGVKVGVERTASQLTGLAEKVGEHSAMTEQKLKELMEQIDKIPAILKTQVQEALAEQQQEITRLHDLLKTKDERIKELEAKPVQPVEEVKS